MTNPETIWQLQTLDSPKILNPLVLQIHHAAQFVSLMGNSLLPKTPDDAQSNMEWVSSKHAIVGRDIELDKGIRVGLLYHPFELHVFDANLDTIEYINLGGETKKEVLNWLRSIVKALGGPPDQIKAITHFEIPHHAVDEGHPFEIQNLVYHQEMAKFRSNADFILKEFTEKFGHNAEVRVWPHHFDSGSYIPLEFDDKGAITKALGLGMAIADHVVDEYYFYITHSAKKDQINYNNLPTLDGEGQWTIDKWVGATLPISRLLDASSETEQYAMASAFFKSGINATLELLGKDDLKV